MGGTNVDIVPVERLDHLGIIAGVIKDLRLIEMIDARLGLDDQEDITTGEAVAGMLLNGLGFADHPMSLPHSSLPTGRSLCSCATVSPRSIATVSSSGGASTRPAPTVVTRCS